MCNINRIVLVGNGFDLAHGLKTKYEDFINWYWFRWYRRLLFSNTNIESDSLCTFSLLKEHSTWHASLIYSSYLNRTGNDFYRSIKSNNENYNITLSPFMERICSSVETNGWVDIENEYYSALNGEYSERPEQLNKEFGTITELLAGYLATVKEKHINAEIVKEELRRKMLSPLKAREIAIGAKSVLNDFIRYKLSSMSEDETLFNDYKGILSAIEHNEIPKELLYPDRLMLLNFNYTNTADLYIPEEDTFTINHIHGNLSDPESIIFGYGDELDDRYKDIMKLNSNEHLRNIKSIKYLKTDHYRMLLSFIDSAPYQIYIMGHSCGNSDRTLLNTLFEHRNCISIKLFFYIKEDGSNSYMETVQNISRNFTDMKLMRDRVVNKTYCEPLLDNNV